MDGEGAPYEAGRARTVRQVQSMPAARRGGRLRAFTNAVLRRRIMDGASYLSVGVIDFSLFPPGPCSRSCASLRRREDLRGPPPQLGGRQGWPPHLCLRSRPVYSRSPRTLRELIPQAFLTAYNDNARGCDRQPKPSDTIHVSSTESVAECGASRREQVNVTRRIRFFAPGVLFLVAAVLLGPRRQRGLPASCRGRLLPVTRGSGTKAPTAPTST